jgi:hypothetical protein
MINRSSFKQSKRRRAADADLDLVVMSVTRDMLQSVTVPTMSP